MHVISKHNHRPTIALCGARTRPREVHRTARSSIFHGLTKYTARPNRVYKFIPINSPGSTKFLTGRKIFEDFHNGLWISYHYFISGDWVFPEYWLSINFRFIEYWTGIQISNCYTSANVNLVTFPSQYLTRRIPHSAYQLLNRSL